MPASTNTTSDSAAERSNSIGRAAKMGAVAFCAAFWLFAIVSCSGHYARAEADRQEAFVSYRGCASCASLTLNP